MKKLAVIIILTALASLSASAQGKWMIYGCRNHDQFLGCMECASDEPGSIWSPFTEYGAIHSEKSIWNKAGLYGSVTSDFSPYNPKARHPPRVVDGSGKCVGYLTVNRKNPLRLKGTVPDLICFSRDTVLRDGIEKYGDTFTRKN
jgi:hypothetical protein